MVSTDVKGAITTWTEWASKPDVQRYDIALFKIWIQFEKFLSNLFLSYATGNPSETGYVPPLNLQFKSEEQFNAFMVDGNKKYIEYFDKIEKLSKHIFVVNPFDILLSDAKYKPVVQEVRALRNYIAHESGEAKRKVINACFSGNERRFVDPNEYLKSRERETRNTYYTYYTTCIAEMVDILIEAPADTEGVTNDTSAGE